MAVVKPQFNVGDSIKAVFGGVGRWVVQSRVIDGSIWRYTIVNVNSSQVYSNQTGKSFVLDKSAQVAGKRPSPPLEPLGEAPPICRYLLNVKVSSVEPITEYLYGRLASGGGPPPGIDWSHAGKEPSAAIGEQYHSLARRMVQKAQRNLREIPICNVTGQPLRLGARVNTPDTPGEKFTAIAMLYCPACNKAHAEYYGEME